MFSSLSNQLVRRLNVRQPPTHDRRTTRHWHRMSSIKDTEDGSRTYLTVTRIFVHVCSFVIYISLIHSLSYFRSLVRFSQPMLRVSTVRENARKLLRTRIPTRIIGNSAHQDATNVSNRRIHLSGHYHGVVLSMLHTRSDGQRTWISQDAHIHILEVTLSVIYLWTYLFDINGK